MKTKMKNKENASSEFNMMMIMDAFVSDYEFISRMYRMNLVMDGVKKSNKSK